MNGRGACKNVKFTKPVSRSPSGDASSDNGCFPCLSPETRRIICRMDRSESYINVKLGKIDSRSPSRAEPDVSYAELHFKTLSTPQVRTDRGGVNPTYSELNFRKEKPRIDEDEDPPISSGPGGPSTTAETVAQEQDAEVKIRNKTHRLICLLCLVTSVLILIVAGLSIHVLQIHRCNVTFERNYNELNSTFQSKLSALNSNLSDLKRMNSDLRHQFTEMETKYRSVNQTKAQICELLTSKREQTCSEGWVTNKDRSYYVSTTEAYFRKAKQQCANCDSRLLQIKSSDEARFVSHCLLDGNREYWIGKCETGNVAWCLLYNVSSGKPSCRQCGPSYPCDRDRRFICEKPAPVFPDVPVKVQGLCQQPVEAT